MSIRNGMSRRNALKTMGAGVAAVGVLPGMATAHGTVVSKINSSGHYAYFPLGPAHWKRQKHQYDFHEAESRWMASPTMGGGVKILVENIEVSGIPNRNAGFDIHFGPIGDVNEVTVDLETLQTASGDYASMFFGIYFDVNKNGEFFAWEKLSGNIERFAGFAGDDEGFLLVDADGTFTMTDSTEFHVFGPDISATWGELKSGAVAGIDGDTPGALYLGVIDKDEGGPEEAVVHDVHF